MSTDLSQSFQENLAAVGGRVRRTGLGGLIEEVRAAVGAAGLVLVTPELAGLAPALSRSGTEARVGAGDELDQALRGAESAVLLGIGGVASTGTVIVGPGGGNGGLLASLPPRTVVVLDESLLVPTLAEALAGALARASDPGLEFMLITGPSRTADIEMMSVTGVHGPLGVEVVLVDLQET